MKSINETSIIYFLVRDFKDELIWNYKKIYVRFKIYFKVSSKVFSTNSYCLGSDI
jgi:hypothetical protein